MGDQKSRRQFLAFAGTGAAAAIAGCGGNAPDDTGTDTESPTDTGTEEPTDTATPTPSEEEQNYTGGTLQMASAGPIQSLDPVNAKGSGAGYNQYGESLMNFPAGDLPPESALATGFEISNGGKTYTFDLKQGVTFHNGDELTAHDIVYSWERLAGAEKTRNADDIVGSTFTIDHEGNTGESVTNYVPGSLAVEAVDDYTFRFTLQTAFHGALSQVAGGAFAIIPEASVDYPTDYEEHDLDGLLYEGEYEYNEFFSTSGDGPFFAATGPFKVEDWSKGNKLELSSFEDYHGEGPYIDGITFTVLGSADTRFKRFKNGNLDIAQIPTAKFDPDRRTIERDRGAYRVGEYELDNDRTVKYGEATVLDTDYVLFNTKRTPKPVRKAFAYIANQHQMAEEIYKGLATPAYHLTPPPVYPKKGEDEVPSENYDKHAENGFRSELDFASDGYMYGYGETQIGEAQRVMEEAGYGEDNRASVEFTVFSGNSTWDQIAKLWADKASAAYIDVEIQKADFGTIITKAINGEMDMFSLGDGMEWPEADNFLRFLHPYDDPAFMFTKWTYEDKSQWTDLMETADAAWNDYYVPNKGPGEQAQQKRNKAYRILEEVNWESMQELPTVHSTSQRLWNPEVKQRMYGPMEDQTFNTLRLER